MLRNKDISGNPRRADDDSRRLRAELRKTGPDRRKRATDLFQTAQPISESGSGPDGAECLPMFRAGREENADETARLRWSART